MKKYSLLIIASIFLLTACEKTYIEPIKQSVTIITADTLNYYQELANNTCGTITVCFEENFQAFTYQFTPDPKRCPILATHTQIK